MDGVETGQGRSMAEDTTPLPQTISAVPNNPAAMVNRTVREEVSLIITQTIEIMHKIMQHLR